MKKLLPVALGSALLLASCNLTQTPDTTLQFSAGTYNVQGQSTLGTALLLRLMPGGARPSQDVQVTITGPSGWNGGAPLTLTYRANEPVAWFLRSTAAVSGTYTATAQVNGQTYTATTTSVDTGSRLDVPGNVRVTESANQSFTVSWQAVNGAVAYLERVIRVIENAPDEIVPNTSIYTTGTSVTLPESALALNTNYTASVTAFNAPVNPAGLGNLVFNKQFNASFGVLPAVFQRNP